MTINWPLFAQSDPLWQFYAANMRLGLFSGFLTLTGFLFAVKTFIVINMKKELYDTPFYRETLRKQSQVNSALTYYGPLRRLSKLLLACVILSLATAISQLTVGLIDSQWSVYFCLLLVLLTIIALIAVLVIIHGNLASWFKHLEEEAKQKHEKEIQAAGR